MRLSNEHVYRLTRQHLHQRAEPSLTASESESSCIRISLVFGLRIENMPLRAGNLTKALRP